MMSRVTLPCTRWATQTISPRIFISARSVGSINVQMVLEPLGGGGNAATAGAQLSDVTMDAARSSVIAAIDRYFSAE